MMSNPDVLILGAGTAGQTAAYDLAEAGLEVAVAEASDTPGGVCALHGCQAKKYYYEVMETVARAGHLMGLGITGLPSTRWREIRDAKNGFTSAIPKNTRSSLQGYGIEYIDGPAVFIDRDTLQVGDRRIKPRYTVLATGARPMDLPFTGAGHLITSTDFLDLPELPGRITFVGGGFISFEFAHFAARLGAAAGEINIVEVADRPLGPFDGEMVELLCLASADAGINIHLNAGISAIERVNDEFRITLEGGKELSSDLVVHGAGRVANIDHLGLDAAGVEYGKTGIKVDAHLRTSNGAVFAAGDCVDSAQLARIADQEAHTAAANILALEEGGSPEPVDYLGSPALLFTYPQLGMVGKTEEALQAEGIKYWKSFEKNLEWPTYRRIGLKHAAYKILIDDDSRILGAHVLSDNSAGLINIFKQAMADNRTVPELHKKSIIAPYPSRESDLVYMLGPLLD